MNDVCRARAGHNPGHGVAVERVRNGHGGADSTHARDPEVLPISPERANRSCRFAAQLFAFSTADTHDAVLCKDTEELITVPARRCVDGVEHRFAEVGTVFRRRACVQ